MRPNHSRPTPPAVSRCHVSQQPGIVTASLFVRLLPVIYTTRQRKIWAGAVCIETRQDMVKWVVLLHRPAGMSSSGAEPLLII